MEPKELEEFILALRKQPIHTWTEKTAQNAAVVELLKMLGWSPFEMQLEYKVGGKRNKGYVDIKLSSGENHLLVECKPPGTKLDDAVGQLLNYAFEDNTHLAALTDGLIWDLYLPFYKSPTRHKFASIDLKSPRDPSDLIAELQRFLGRREVETGEAERVAEERMKAIQRGEKIKDSLPAAWIDLIAQPPKELIALIANEVQRRSGHRPADYQVCEFLSKRGEFASSLAPSEPATQYSWRESAEHTTTSSGRQPKKTISAFVLWGQRTEVTNWRDLLFEVAIRVYPKHMNEFARVANEVPWVARSDSNMIAARRILNSPYYINVHGGAPGLENHSRRLLEILGYSRSDLIIESSDPLTQPVRRESRTRQVFSVDTDRASAASISAFVLWGQHTTVTSWVELLIGVTTIMYQRHGNDLDHMTKKVSWLSRNSTILKKPNAIPGSSFYVNSYAGAKVLKDRCRSLLKFFGHSPDDLQIIE